MFQEWLKKYEEIKEKHECICEKAYEQIDIKNIISINTAKGTIQIIENNHGTFGVLICEIPINYCPMCGRKLSK